MRGRPDAEPSRAVILSLPAHADVVCADEHSVGARPLAAFIDRSTGAPSVWFSTDGLSWQRITGVSPAIGIGDGRRGVRFVANEGAGGHRVEFYEQNENRPASDINLGFDDPAWQAISTSTEPGVVVLHDSAREAAVSGGEDRIVPGSYATA